MRLLFDEQLSEELIPLLADFALQEVGNGAAHFIVGAWIAVHRASLPRLVVTGWNHDTVQRANQLQARVEQSCGE